MYPQYLQQLLRTEAHADTAYLTGVVVRVRNKTPSFRASFDALFTLATLDNGTTVYTHTPARPDTFRADVAALLRGAAARGHVSEAVVVGALSGKPVPKPAKRASKPGKRGVLARLVRGGDAMPEPGVDQAGAMNNAAILERTDAQADAADDAAILERTDAQADAADDAAILERTDAQADAADDAAILERTDAQADAVGGAAILERTDAQADAVGGAAGGGNAVPVDNGTGPSKAGSASVATAGAASGGGARKKAKWRKATERDLRTAFTERNSGDVLLGARVIVGQRPCPALPVRGPYDDPYGRTYLASNGISEVAAQVYDVTWVDSAGVFAVDNGVSPEKWKNIAGASMQKPAAAARNSDNARGVAMTASMLSVYSGTRAEWLLEAKEQELRAMKRLPTDQESVLDEQLDAE